MWERVILDTLARRPNKKSEYIVLRSEQLVGTALIVLVRTDITGAIRKVEAATRKVCAIFPSFNLPPLIDLFVLLDGPSGNVRQ